jgi:hypothetical protein
MFVRVFGHLLLLFTIGFRLVWCHLLGSRLAIFDTYFETSWLCANATAVTNYARKVRPFTHAYDSWVT